MKRFDTTVASAPAADLPCEHDRPRSVPVARRLLYRPSPLRRHPAQVSQFMEQSYQLGFVLHVELDVCEHTDSATGDPVDVEEATGEDKPPEVTAAAEDFAAASVGEDEELFSSGKLRSLWRLASSESVGVPIELDFPMH